MGRSMIDMPEILIQNASLTPAPFSRLLQDHLDQAAKGTEAKTQFRMAGKAQPLSSPVLFLSVSPVSCSPLQSLEEAQIRCSEYLNNVHRTSNRSCIILTRAHESRGGGPIDSECIIVLGKVEHEFGSASPSGADEQGLENNQLQACNEVDTYAASSWTGLKPCWGKRSGYRAIPAEKKSALSWNRLIISCSVSIFIILTLGLALLIVRGGTEDMYDRYITSGSVGPKHQLRIYWQNASEWAASNPQDTGKWRVRIDDQAIIPAELYDEDEEHYQQWYRRRYPEMQQVIDNRDYIRPSWMGSLNMMVPWDDQFHFAHCVLALRRYWKAKETGRHVCGRDIDYLHIEHCLSSLEKRVFVDGKREIEDPPTYMYWQTKVCF